MTLRKFNEPGAPPDQRAARKTYGDAVIDELVARPTLNQRCWKCHQHHGLVCVCSRAEKRAAYALMVRHMNKITPGTYRG